MKKKTEIQLPNHLDNLLGVMGDYRWHSLSNLSEQLGLQQTTVSAMLRKLRAHGFELERKEINRQKSRVIHLYKLSLE